MDVRETFGRMGMNDEETAALTVGGHSIGRAHGNGDPANFKDQSQREQIFKNKDLDGILKTVALGVNQITQGIEGAWTTNPDKWDHHIFRTSS